jgi:hypothetical protein
MCESLAAYDRVERRIVRRFLGSCEQIRHDDKEAPDLGQGDAGVQELSESETTRGL